MKNKVFFLLLALLAMSQAVQAYDFTYTYQGQTLYYSITNSSLHQVELVNPVSSNYSSYVSGAVVIPDSVENAGIRYAITSIGQYSFTNCTSLTSITISNSVTTIGDMAFYQCTGLTSVTIPNSVTSIGYYAFDGCTGLTSVTIPNSVTSIRDWAFESCSGLTSINIPNSVTSISFSAFRYCTGLTSVTIPNTVTSIGNQAFSGCTGLTSVTIGNSVDTIGALAFSNCTSLTTVNYTGTMAQWCGIGFCNYTSNPIYYSHSLSINGSPVTNLVIPDSATTIKKCAFYNCSGLTSATIGNSVTSIGENAFYNCTGLTSVTIGNSVTSIGQTAFSGCIGLTEINCSASVAPQLGSNAFLSVTSTIPVNIPCGSSASYYSRWSYFSNFVEAAASTLSVQSANTAMGTVSILTQPTCQAPTAVFHAVANNGFQFSHWNDLNTDNPRSILLTQDTSFTAYFTPAAHDTVIVHDTVTILDTVVITHNYHDTVTINNYIYDTIYLHDTIYIHDTIFVGGEGIGDVKTIDAKIYARDGQIVVEGAEGMPVVLYDAVGRMLVARREDTHGGTPLRFDVPASGVYLVKVGDWPARRIVMLR